MEAGGRRTIELVTESGPGTNSTDGPSPMTVQIVDHDEDGTPSPIASMNATTAKEKDFKKWRRGSKTLHIEKKLGLLFDDSLFTGGAAGTAMELDGQIYAFEIRADGKILKCAGAGESKNGLCECN